MLRRMTFHRRFHVFLFSACAVFALSLPAVAQQRIQISDLVQRLERLETEVVRLRVSPGGGGGADIVRLDQIEQELRRLTGIIERLDFETRRSATERDRRLDALEARLDAEKSTPPVQVPASPNFTTDTGFSVTGPSVSASEPQALVGSEFTPSVQTDPVFQPQQQFPGQPEPVFQSTFNEAPPATPTFQGPESLYDEGVRLLNVGSFDQAGAQFEDLIATYPDDPNAGQAQFWLGDMHFKLGRFEQAATAFLESFRKWPAGPKAPDSLLKLGMTLANIGKTEEACLSFKQVAARYPGADPTLLRRADIESQRYRCGS